MEEIMSRIMVTSGYGNTVSENKGGIPEKEKGWY